MKPRLSFLLTILVLALLGAYLAGCENTDLTAESDWLLTVIAVPPQPEVNEETGRARTVIVAKVVDVNDVPVENVAVTFSAPSGSFVDNVCGAAGCSVGGAACTTDADCPLPPTVPVVRKTDTKGVCQTLFAMGPDDGETITVTATSGGLSSTVNVLNQLGEVNQRPIAVFVVSPSSPADGLPVRFDGAGSSDPDGDELTCFKWQINSSIPIVGPEISCDPPDAKCEVIQDTISFNLSSKYSNEQKLDVNLWVSDDPDAAACPRGGPALPESLFGLADYDDYIICYNTPPVANAGDYPGTYSLSADGLPTVKVTLDGSATDQETTELTQLTYSWSCGNGQTSSGKGLTNPICEYGVEGLYEVRLTVSDPGGGNEGEGARVECRLTSGISSANITIVP